MSVTTGAARATVSVQVVSSNPVALVPRIVIVCGEPAIIGVGQLTRPVEELMVMPTGPATSAQAVIGFMQPGFVSAGLGPVYAPPQSRDAFGISTITGATGLTVNDQVSVSEPAEFVARIVIVCGEPTDVGDGQLTTPVVLLIVIPEGVETRAQVTDDMHDEVSVGIGPV